MKVNGWMCSLLCSLADAVYLRAVKIYLAEIKDAVRILRVKQRTYVSPTFQVALIWVGLIAMLSPGSL